VATGLYGKLVQPVLTDVGPRRALVYVGRSAEPGLPRPGTLEPVIAAARAIGAPDPYLRELEAWLPATRPEPARFVRPLRFAPAPARQPRPL
jgi:hypothetical protein